MNITAQIRAAILEGRYPAGSLLSQTELAKEYTVSRIPIRDALLGLAADQLVEVIPGKGARVILLSAEELEEVFELRIMLECTLLHRAVSNADEAAKAEVLYVLRRSSLEAGRPGWHNGDWDFHRSLYSAAARPRHLAIIDHLRTICVVQACRYAALAADTPRWLDDHEAIAAAFIAGQADEASTLLASHLRASLDRLRTLVAATPEGS